MIHISGSIYRGGGNHVPPSHLRFLSVILYIRLTKDRLPREKHSLLTSVFSSKQLRGLIRTWAFRAP